MSSICGPQEGTVSEVKVGRIVIFDMGQQGEADVDVEGCRVFPGITISLYPTVNIVIRTHGDAVPIKVVESSSEKIIVSLHTIERALRHVNATCLYLGQKLPDHNDDYTKSVDIAVSGSRFVCIKSSSAVSTSIISNSCLLLIPSGSSACKACQYAYKLCMNRKRKRSERAELANSISELEESIKVTLPLSNPKEKPTSCNQNLAGDEANIEMLSFEKCDNDDLRQITEEIGLKNNVPEDMKLLCDMQMKQLASKSANGHRKIYTITLSCIKTSIQLLSLRYYKNAVNQEAGWNQEVINWCQSEAKRQQLKPADYWGCLVLDEMKIQHNIKKLRNNLEKSSASGSARCLKNGDDHIFWRFWKDAYLWDQSQHSCPIHEKLKEDHFQLTPSSRMRNNLAEDVLDKKMLFLMKAYQNHLECSENQEHASRLNGSIMSLQHTSFMVEFFSSKQAIYDSNDTRLQSLLSTLSYFSKWKASVLKSDEFKLVNQTM
ncbi:Hypothetical predicted protein, partial [Paramuricea clavata]